MARFINDITKVIVSVADEKADRFASGWTALADGETEPRKTRKARTAKAEGDTEPAGETAGEPAGDE